MKNFFAVATYIYYSFFYRYDEKVCFATPKSF